MEEILLSFEDTLNSHKAQNLQQLRTCNISELATASVLHVGQLVIHFMRKTNDE